MGHDGFAPGKWELEAWMESGGKSARGEPGARQTDTVILSEVDAGRPPAAVFFHRFYHGARSPAATFRDGKVEGGFHQPRVDDIGEHDVPIRGTYARDHFRIVFGYRAFGMLIEQVVEGRLVEGSGGR